MGGAPAMNAPAGAAPQGGYDPFAAPQQDLPGPLDDLARRLPQSKPGTLFGIPLSTLRDVSVQKTLMLMAGVALIAAVFIPWQLSPTEFSWGIRDPGDGDKMIFSMVVWPLIAGAVYLLMTAAPPDMRKNIPPIVLQWLPFGVSILGIIITRAGGFTTFFAAAATYGAKHDRDSALAMKDMWDMLWLYSLGYSVLCFGLLARLAQPNDQIARIVIAVGAGCTLLLFFGSFGLFFSFKAGALFGIHNLLFFIVSLVAIACFAFVVPAAKVPALAAVDALAPAVTAVLLAWLPLEAVLLLLANLIHGHDKFLNNILGFAHMLLPVVAFFGVMMVTAPAAYDELKAAIGKKGAGGPPGGYPPQGGGYPPQGGGYPPPGGGYPPPGGGYPPQGGGYPPQGGGYPPQGGGGYPPPGGGYPQQ
jgi:hypothetical protein